MSKNMFMRAVWRAVGEVLAWWVFFALVVAAVVLVIQGGSWLVWVFKVFAA